jgi:hypothetical protein
MRTSATGFGDAAQITREERDRMFNALPASGKDAQGGFALWAFGVPGVKGEQVDAIIANDRVQMELRESPIDPVELTRAIESAALQVGAGNVYDALRQPMEKLMLLGALRG